MSTNDNVRSIDCARAMDRIHRRLDGDELDADASSWLAGHVATCEACRRANRELQQIQSVLRGLAEDELPDQSLQKVWESTSRSPRGVGRASWRLVAAGIVAAAIAFGLWHGLRPAPDQPVQVANVIHSESPTAEELDRAEQELRMVLNITASALRRTERVTVDEVLGKRIAPAIGKIPIRWERKTGGDGDV